MATFAIGDRVKSHVEAQGLVKGATYRVTAIETLHTPFGEFVFYTVVGKNRRHHRITNGHLLLTKEA